MLGWRITRDRLPHFSNLSIRGVDVPSILCPICEEEIKDLSHVFVNYRKVVGVWQKCMSWWQLPWHSSSISMKEIVVGSSTFIDNWRNKIFHGVCLVVMWGIWKWRNNIVYTRAEDRSAIREVDIFPSIQILSLLWISNRCSRLAFDWSGWVTNPPAAFLKAGSDQL